MSKEPIKHVPKPVLLPYELDNEEEDDEIKPTQNKTLKKEKKNPSKSGEEKLVFPFAINFTRLQAYSNDFLLDIHYVIVFEYLLMLSDLFLHRHGAVEFFHSVKSISTGTMLTKHKVNQILEYFEEYDLLKSEKKGIHNMSHYEFRYSRLQELWPLIISDIKNTVEEKNNMGKENTLRMKITLRNKKKQSDLTKIDTNKKAEDW